MENRHPALEIHRKNRRDAEGHTAHDTGFYIQILRLFSEKRDGNKREGHPAAVLKMLKAIRAKDKEKLIEGFMEFVSLVENESDIQLANEIFDLGLVYLLNRESDITKEELIRASLERGDSVQTLAQRLLDEGRQEGREELLWKMMTKKFPDLDPDYYKRLAQLDSVKLDELSLELLDMQDRQALDTFFSRNCE